MLWLVDKAIHYNNKKQLPNELHSPMFESHIKKILMEFWPTDGRIAGGDERNESFHIALHFVSRAENIVGPFSPCLKHAISPSVRVHF